jgi:mannose-1-phosphate guanylyltransferase
MPVAGRRCQASRSGKYARQKRLFLTAGLTLSSFAAPHHAPPGMKPGRSHLEPVTEGGRSDMNGAHRPFAVILAGGIGSRFWPVSTPARPKQLLPLGGDQPLIADTVERAVRLAGLDRLLIVTGSALVAPFRATVPELDDEHFLVEPTARGTGPALAWAAWEIRRRDPAAVMVSLHADHVIAPYESFEETISTTVRAAVDTERLFCVGIRPERPETGYGYVQLGRQLVPGVHAVRRFVEKPDLETARMYLSAGEYLWNSGIFVWQPAALLEAIRRFTPELAPGLESLEAGDVKGFFGAVEPITIDHGVMERADSVGVVEATFAWDDVGSWNALARTRESDSSGNVAVGRAFFIDAGDNIVWSEDDEVALFGVDGLVVVRSGARTLVTSRKAAPDLKRLVDRLMDEDEA